MTQYLPTRTRCINSKQRGGTVPPSSPASARGRAVGSGGSPINHPLTNCRTGRFARNIGSARPGRAVFLPAVFLYERRLPQYGLRKKDPAGSARTAEARKPRKWGITVFITRSLLVRLMEVRQISIFDIAGRLPVPVCFLLESKVNIKHREIIL